MNILLLLCIVLAILSIVDAQRNKIKYRNEFETESVVLLDSFTFPKIVPNPNHAVVVLVTNKREIGEYGTDSIRADFFDFAKRGITEGKQHYTNIMQI